MRNSLAFSTSLIVRMRIQVSHALTFVSVIRQRDRYDAVEYFGNIGQISACSPLGTVVIVGTDTWACISMLFRAALELTEIPPGFRHSSIARVFQVGRVDRNNCGIDLVDMRFSHRPYLSKS